MLKPRAVCWRRRRIDPVPRCHWGSRRIREKSYACDVKSHQLLSHLDRGSETRCSLKGACRDKGKLGHSRRKWLFYKGCVQPPQLRRNGWPPRPICGRLLRCLRNFQSREVVADQMSEFSPYLGMTPSTPQSGDRTVTRPPQSRVYFCIFLCYSVHLQPDRQSA